MKVAYIVRHAKSSWDYAELADRDRPLNKRGRADAPLMGKKLKEKEVKPDRLISSPAVRALTTANLIAKEIDYPIGEIDINLELYGAGEDEWLEIIRGLDNSYNSVMLFGHNPSVTEFVNMIAESRIHNIPTCGIAALALDTDQWGEANSGNCTLKFYEYPKMFK